jgi:hypothetical protein
MGGLRGSWDQTLSSKEMPSWVATICKACSNKARALAAIW